MPPSSGSSVRSGERGTTGRRPQETTTLRDLYRAATAQSADLGERLPAAAAALRRREQECSVPDRATPEAILRRASMMGGQELHSLARMSQRMTGYFGRTRGWSPVTWCSSTAAGVSSAWVEVVQAVMGWGASRRWVGSVCPLLASLAMDSSER